MANLTPASNIFNMVRALNAGDQVQVFFGNLRISGEVTDVNDNVLSVREISEWDSNLQVIHIDIVKIIAFSKK